MAMERDYDLDKAVACNTTVAGCDAIDMRTYAGAIVIVPDASTIVLLTPHVCDTESGTFQPLYDEDATPVAQVVAANRACVLTSSAYAAHWLKLVSNAAGTVDLLKKC